MYEELSTEELQDVDTVVLEPDVDDSLTAEDVQLIVDNSITALNDANQERYDSLQGEIQQLGDSVMFLAESNEEQGQQDDATYTVLLDTSQVETAKVCARILVTEGFFLVVLLAVQIGLIGWQVVADRWRNVG